MPPQARQLYKDMCRADRLRQHYHDILVSQSPYPHDYPKKMHNLHERTANDIAWNLGGYRMIDHLGTLSDRPENDKYYDWGWLFDYLPIYKALDIERRAGVIKRDTWTREHPCPHTK